MQYKMPVIWLYRGKNMLLLDMYTVVAVNLFSLLLITSSNIWPYTDTQ